MRPAFGMEVAQFGHQPRRVLCRRSLQVRVSVAGDDLGSGPGLGWLGLGSGPGLGAELGLGLGFEIRLGYGTRASDMYRVAG